jgi:hypothetical protein
LIFRIVAELTGEDFNMRDMQVELAKARGNCSRPFFLWDFGKVVWKFDWRIRS